MDLATLALNEQEAHATLEAHANEGIRGEAYAEYDRLMVSVCEEVLLGRQIVDVRACVRAGGTVVVEHFESFYDTSASPSRFRSEVGPVLMPRIALARADAPFCWCHAIPLNGQIRFQGVTGWWKKHPAKKEAVTLDDVFDQRREYRLHRRRKPHYELIKRTWMRALVPAVPVALRPAEGLAGTQILWEAEWDSQPPGDPALLKPLGGDLASVLAVWDLTPLEKAVLAGSRS